MTAHLPIVPRKAVDRARAPDFAPSSFAPPGAPLHMPKQVLTPTPGVLRRGVARILSVLPTGRRRPG